MRADEYFEVMEESREAFYLRKHEENLRRIRSAARLQRLHDAFAKLREEEAPRSHGNRVIDDYHTERIRDMRAAGRPVAFIARDLGISKSSVRRLS